jgi:hypothetical protein
MINSKRKALTEPGHGAPSRSCTATLAVDHPRFLLLTGPPGAGKSTIARRVAAHWTRSVCLESDWMWTTILNGHVSPWEKAADDQNRTMLRASVAAALRMVDGGYSTVVEGIIDPGHLDVVFDEVGARSLPMTYVVLRPDLATCLARATTRTDVRVPGHPALTDPVPIERTWRQFEHLGPFERHVLDTSMLDPDEVAARLTSLVDRRQWLITRPP